MKTTALAKFLELTSKTRHSLRSGAEIVQFATEHGIRLAPSDLWSLAGRLGLDGGVCPPSIVSFVVRLLEGFEPKRVLDPHVGFGTLLQPVVAATRASDFAGAYPIDDSLKVAEWVQPTETRGEYHTRDLRGETLAHLGEFDLVVAQLPFGLKAREFSVEGTTLRGEGGLELLLRSSLRLSTDGLAVFVAPPNVHLSPPGRSVLSSLSTFGLYLDASFHVPPGAFMPLTSSPANVLVIRRGTERKTLFAARLSVHERPLNSLISNYRVRKPGSAPDLGVLVSPTGYRGFEVELSKHRVDTLTERLDLPKRHLSHYTLEITRCPRNAAELKPRDNAFFLPLTVPSPCKTTTGHLPKRPTDYVQVVLDPKKADSNVMAGFFDSNLGCEVRASRASGVAIRRIQFATVQDLPVWLPDIAEQRTLTKLDQRLRTISSEANELRERLWEGLNRTEEVGRRLEQVNREDTYLNWLDTLPFPLAITLWNHHTLSGRPLKRYRQLELFFEALTQFLGVWLMSGVRASQELFEMEWKSIRRTLDRAGLSVERSTSGTWTRVLERLAKRVRSGIHGEVEDRQYWESSFACDSPELLRNLTSKSMVNIASRANELRNPWLGHSGTVGDTEARRRESALLELLADFRSLVGNRWEHYPLVFPDSSRYSGGIFLCKVSWVVGTRHSFRRKELTLKAPLEDGWLHFVSPLTGAVCPLLPLVRLGPTGTTERNACYFFNRLDAERGQRYVSYHFEERPDLVEDVPAASDLLLELSSYG